MRTACALAAVLALAFAGRAWSQNEPIVEVDAVGIASLELNAMPARGTPGMLRVVLFSDFGCPACALEYPVIEELLALYPGQIEFHYYAIAGPSHPWARSGYVAARCVGEQSEDGFWRAAKNLYEHARSIDDINVGEKAAEMALQLGADETAFSECYTGTRYLEEVDANLRRGVAVGLRSTPSLLIGDKLYVGARKLEELQTLVDEALSRREKSGGFWDWLR